MAGPYCSACGEKKISAEAYSIGSVFHEVAEDIAHFDSKILRTLKALLTKPGLLSQAYFYGGRSRYTKPLTLFIVLNLVFFVIQPHSGLMRYQYDQYTYAGNPNALKRIRMIRAKLVESGETERSYRIRFNARLQEQKKSLLILSVPALALGMSLLYFRRRRFYVEHLIFSTNVYAFLLISLMGLAAFFKIIPFIAALTGPMSNPILKMLDGELGISILLGSVIVPHIFLALRRAYAETRLRAAAGAIFLMFLLMMLTGFYHSFLFYATYFTT